MATTSTSHDLGAPWERHFCICWPGTHRHHPVLDGHRTALQSTSEFPLLPEGTIVLGFSVCPNSSGGTLSFVRHPLLPFLTRCIAGHESQLVLWSTESLWPCDWFGERPVSQS